MWLPSTVRTWGSTPAERAASYPCDRHIDDADEVLYRAVDVAAPAPLLFRWLCQLRAAPYSYDWLDNRGRRSPPVLTPGLDELELGQSVMTIFRLIDFAPDDHLTLSHRGRLFGDIACTYRAVPRDAQRCRLVVKMRVRHTRRSAVLGFVLRQLLPAGDLVMMRRQLHNLKRLAEATAQAGRSGTNT